MDVRFPEGGQSIEYSTLGGIVDLFFFAGPTPADVARQGSEVWGRSAEVPYWALGFHSCRYGYEDIAYVAEVVSNVSLPATIIAEMKLTTSTPPPASLSKPSGW
jgi:alpha-glucosidase